MKRGRPAPDEYADFQAGYVARVPEDDVLAVMAQQAEETLALLGGLGEEQAGVRYAPGKWSLKEMLGHMSDAERVWAYRAMRFSRGDATPLPSYEQDDWVRRASFDRCRWRDLVKEFALVRQANLLLFRNLDEDAWLRRGVASGNEVSVRALAYIIVGHERQHVALVRERYVPAMQAGG